MVQNEQDRSDNTSEVRELLSPDSIPSCALPPYDDSGRSLRSSAPDKEDTESTKNTTSEHVAMSQIVSLPLVNIIITCVLIGVLLYIYIKANGQSTEYTLANMKIPTLVSLIVTLLKMCMAGGLGYALSEYKWVKLQYGNSRLALLDVYDACTRGLGGIVRVFSAVPFDFVLIPAIIFQLGLIAIGPASQQILLASRPVNCALSAGASKLNRMNPSTAQLFTLDDSVGARGLIGIKQNFIVQFAWSQSSGHVDMPLQYKCPATALNCTFTQVPTLHTSLDCQSGSLEKTNVIDIGDGTVMLLKDYYTKYANFANFQSINTPDVFYGGSMHGRTAVELNNATKPTGPFAQLNMSDILPFVGDQVMVLVTNQSYLQSGYSIPESEVAIYECTLRSYLNQSTFAASGQKINQTVISSTPITMNYTLISNTTFADSYQSGSQLMMNAYALQLSIMRTFIISLSPLNFRGMSSRWIISGEIPIWAYLSKVLHDISLAVTMVSTDPAGLDFMIGNDTICKLEDTATYSLNPASYYTLSLSLLVPLIWWILVWIISLYQTNGISRGNSQIALLVTGLTPALHEKFRGFSHAGQGDLFKQSKEINVQFGETRTSDGHVTFGFPEELNPIRHRRTSVVAHIE